MAQELSAFSTLMGGGRGDGGKARKVRGRLADAGCLAAKQKGC